MLLIKTASLKAACLLASKKDVRYYLNGVNIRSTAQGVIVESTNGNAAFQDMADLSPGASALDFTIPIAIAEKLSKHKGATLAFTQLVDGSYECNEFKFKSIDGNFPTIDRVMPTAGQLDGLGTFDFDFELLAICQKAMRIATGKVDFFRLTTQTSGGALMHRETEQYPRCVAMPLNLNKVYKDN